MFRRKQRFTPFPAEVRMDPQNSRVGQRKSTSALRLSRLHTLWTVGTLPSFRREAPERRRGEAGRTTTGLRESRCVGHMKRAVCAYVSELALEPGTPTMSAYSMGGPSVNHRGRLHTRLVIRLLLSFWMPTPPICMLDPSTHWYLNLLLFSTL